MGCPTHGCSQLKGHHKDSHHVWGPFCKMPKSAPARWENHFGRFCMAASACCATHARPPGIAHSVLREVDGSMGVRGNDPELKHPFWLPSRNPLLYPRRKSLAENQQVEASKGPLCSHAKSRSPLQSSLFRHASHCFSVSPFIQKRGWSNEPKLKLRDQRPPRKESPQPPLHARIRFLACASNKE